MAEGKKPAGWKDSDRDGPFWIRGDLLKCKEENCGKQSHKDAPESARHSPFCPKRVGGSRVVLDETEADERRALYGQRQAHPIDAVMEQVRAIEKQGKPEISDVYRQWVKLGACCNCGWPGPNDPHHEDTTIPALRRGVRQKARDTSCVSLCRACHDSLTGIGGGYRLPAADGEHTAEESKAILHDAQEERLRRALDAFPQEWRIEILSKGVACVPEAVKRAALLGSETEDRLVEALDASGEELI